jgi:hypothetical protein
MYADAAILGLTLVTFSMSYLIAQLELTILGELLGYLAVGVEVSRFICRRSCWCLS